MEIRCKYPYCASVAFYNSSYFRTHAFKVREDAEFVKKAFQNGDEKTLSYLELFYKELLAERTCEKDVFSKNERSLITLPKKNESF